MPEVDCSCSALGEWWHSATHQSWIHDACHDLADLGLATDCKGCVALIALIVAQVVPFAGLVVSAAAAIGCSVPVGLANNHKHRTNTRTP